MELLVKHLLELQCLTTNESRDHLTVGEANMIDGLVQALHPYDKQTTVYPPRAKRPRTSGRFMKMKESNPEIETCAKLDIYMQLMQLNITVLLCIWVESILSIFISHNEAE